LPCHFSRSSYSGKRLDRLTGRLRLFDPTKMTENIASSVGSKLSRCELARHEAGHAVSAALLGLPIEWVLINEANGYGEVEPKTNPFFRLAEPFESRRRLAITMAGSVAQCLAAGCNPRWMPGSEGDKRLAENLAEETGLSPDDFSMVIAILSRPDVWEKVDCLAAALLREGELAEWTGLMEFLPERDLGVCERVGIVTTWGGGQPI
jgi:hypothetical protein